MTPLLLFAYNMWVSECQSHQSVLHLPQKQKEKNIWEYNWGKWYKLWGIDSSKQAKRLKMMWFFRGDLEKTTYMIYTHYNTVRILMGPDSCLCLTKNLQDTFLTWNWLYCMLFCMHCPHQSASLSSSCWEWLWSHSSETSDHSWEKALLIVRRPDKRSHVGHLDRED